MRKVREVLRLKFECGRIRPCVAVNLLRSVGDHRPRVDVARVGSSRELPSLAHHQAEVLAPVPPVDDPVRRVDDRA